MKSSLKQWSWFGISILLMLMVYVLSVGLAEKVAYHDSSSKLRKFYAPVDYLGEQPSFANTYYQYLSFWTGETQEQISERKNGWWEKYRMSQKARSIEANLGIENVP